MPPLISEAAFVILAFAVGIKDVYCLQLNSPAFLEQLFSNKMGNPDIVSDNKQDSESFREFQQRPNSAIMLKEVQRSAQFDLGQ